MVLLLLPRSNRSTLLPIVKEEGEEAEETTVERFHLASSSSSSAVAVRAFSSSSSSSSFLPSWMSLISKKESSHHHKDKKRDDRDGDGQPMESLSSPSHHQHRHQHNQLTRVCFLVFMVMLLFQTLTLQTHSLLRIMYPKLQTKQSQAKRWKFPEEASSASLTAAETETDTDTATTSHVTYNITTTTTVNDDDVNATSLIETFLFYRNQSLTQRSRRNENAAKSVALAQSIAKHAGLPWLDMDWSQGNPVGCGFHKCFFASSTNSSLGYLVSVGGEELLQDRKQAFQIEQDLVAKYGIPTVSVEAPHVVPHVDDGIHTILDAYSHIKNGKRYSDSVFRQRMGNQTNTLNVQQVWKVPEPNLLVGFLGPKLLAMQKNLPEFVKQIRRNNHNSLFRAQFPREIQRNQDIVSDPEYASFLCDYHAIVTTTGKMYFIDMDGHFSTSCAETGENRIVRTVTAEVLQSNMTDLYHEIMGMMTAT
jgi:hypothetical protein